jgi:16S rRNA (guanine966-N2)-methyltransferase
MRSGKRPDRPAGRLRIIGGHWRGSRVDVARQTAVRPTPDRVRETLFNWLAPRIADARCLDLYAGTGILGLEALSRGAREVCFVERDPRLAAAIRRRADTLGANADVVCADAMRYLESPGAAPFDIAFVDPPYDLPVTGVLAKLRHVLAPGGLVYAERAAGEGLPDVPGFEWPKRGRAGAVCFGLARMAEPAD